MNHIKIGLEIAESRSNAWKAYASRKHVAKKVYVHNDAGDILLIGNLESELKNGKKITNDFIANIVLDLSKSSKPKFKAYKAWSVWVLSLFLVTFSYKERTNCQLTRLCKPKSDLDLEHRLLTYDSLVNFFTFQRSFHKTQAS